MSILSIYELAAQRAVQLDVPRDVFVGAVLQIAMPGSQAHKTSLRAYEAARSDLMKRRHKFLASVAKK